MAGNDVPIICNGFKDDEFIETAMLAQKIGRQIFLVVEKYTELELILRLRREARRAAARSASASSWPPRGRAAGRRPAGTARKFGLTVTRDAPRPGRAEGRGHGGLLQAPPLPPGQPDHQHPPHQGGAERGRRGSTPTSSSQGAGLEYLDVGGGLGVDYDGSQTNFESSVNYTLQEYANDVVFHVQSVCDDAGVPHPTIISESGRAVVAYHSVLVFNVLGVSGAVAARTACPPQLPDDAEQPLHDLLDTYQDLNVRNLLESYHDAQQALDMALSLFGGGYLPLEQRCRRGEPVLGDLPQDPRA